MADAFDVTSLYGRPAASRVNRVAVGDVLERSTWSRPDEPAIIAWEGACADPAYARVTYREANEVANRFANGLLATGLERGDRVVMVCDNSVEAYLVKLATAKAGLVVAPVNPGLAPDVVAHIVGLVEPRLAVVDAELWPRVEDAFGETGLNPAVTIEIGGDAVAGSVSFGEFIREQPDSEPDVEIHGDDIWEIQFTSGTTAMPKAVMLSHVYTYLTTYGFALSVSRGLRFESDLRQCTFLPIIYHVGHNAFLLPALFCGGSVVLGRRYTPEAVAAAVAQERVTMLWGGSPQMLAGLVEVIEREQLDVTSLTVVLYGWAGLPPSLAETLQRLSPGVAPLGIFGQTEAIACHRFWPQQWPQKFERESPQRNHVGLPPPILGSTIWDEQGNDLAGSPGVPGEVVYRSPVVTAGYYRNEEATREAFEGGWFHSGDSCTYDEDGLRVMLDRYKDVVKSGGENVSSLRVEAILHRHPGVQAAAVVGLPHQRWGEAVTAVVVARPDRDQPSQEELIEHCRGTLAGFATPKRVVFVEELPVTVGAKVLKYKLREQYKDLYAAESSRAG